MASSPKSDPALRLPAPVHPDHVTGALAELLQLLARPARNTLAELDVYRGLPLDALFPAPARVPRVQRRRRWALPGLVSEDLVFRSLHRPLARGFARRYRREYAENHTVYARRIRPRSSRARPRLLYLHGYMQPETWVEELGLLAAMALRLDVEIVQLQPPYHGRRTPRAARFGGELYWTADLVRSLEALRQNLLDARTLLGWLLARDERPVGVSGLSLGGALAACLTCLEPRFAFSIPLIAHMDLGALVRDAPVLGRMRRELGAFGWSPADFAAFVRELGWESLAPVLPPGRIQIFAADADAFFDPEVVREMWRRWGEPEIHWYPCSHMGFVARLPQVLGRMRAFIDRAAAAP